MAEFCRACNGTVPTVFKERLDTPHEGELRCGVCSRFLKWQAKPKNDDKRPKGKHTAENLGVDRCQMCTRDREMLGKNEVLTVHHVTEIQHGGADEPQNIWVLCSHCHAIVHHFRCYLHDHFMSLEA